MIDYRLPESISHIGYTPTQKSEKHGTTRDHKTISMKYIAVSMKNIYVGPYEPLTR